MKDEKQHRGRLLLFPFRAGLFAVSVATFLVATSLPTVSTFAQARPATPPGATKGTPAQPASAEERLAGAWTLFYAGKHAEAITAAEALYRDKDEPIRLEARHVAARALFAGAVVAEATRKDGGKAGFAKADQLWKELGRSTNNANLVRLSISQALNLDYRKDYAAASSLLEKALERNLASTATTEAAIELAGVLAKQGKFDEADKTLNFVGPFLDRQVRIEMMEAEAAPFRQAVRDMQAKMPYFRNAGMKEFEQAESLRQQKKYPEAVAALRSIVKSFPTSDFAPRSEYTIGLCLLAGQGQKQAIDHWQKFIASAPAGPWRGPSYVAIIDCYLADLDLANATKYTTLAKSNLADALADEKSNPSWKPAQFDVVLRAGIVSYCQGNTRAAAEAFADAQACAPSQEIADNIEPLVLAAKAGKDVIPADVKGGGSGSGGIGGGGGRDTGTSAPPRASPSAVTPSDRVALALSIGVIHLATNQLDNAQTLFDRVTGTSAIPAKAGQGNTPGTPAQPARPAMQGATPAQRAFATFGKGAVLQASANGSPVKLEQAKAFFQASIKAFGEGSWQYESFYRVASITQAEADSKFVKTFEPTAKLGQPAKPLTPAEKEAAAKTEKEHNVELAQASAQAIPLYKTILEKYPHSPRCEESVYRIVVTQFGLAEAGIDENGKPLSVASQEKAWKSVAAQFQTFLEKYPRSQWAGDALTKSIDVALEVLDLNLARQFSAVARRWAKEHATPEAKMVTASLPPWAIPIAQPAPSPFKASLYGIYVRCGIIAYLDRQHQQAVECFEAAKPLQPDRKYVVAQGQIPTYIELIQAAAEAKKDLTPKEVLNGDATTQLKLQFADIITEAGLHEKAIALYDSVLSGKSPQVTPLQRSWAHFQRAKTIYAIPDCKKAKQDYLACQEAFPKAPWAAEALFYAGTITDNFDQDKSTANEIYAKVVKFYPQSDEAERASYFIGVNLQHGKDWAKAKVAYESFLKQFPDSHWAASVKDKYLPQVEYELKAGKNVRR
ncbi:MAG: tetratricopeptide repeat protein [Phycisphaerae bacterium]|nr:tetratricopeptide repeat protein [Phycisphaerae bacterium]